MKGRPPLFRTREHASLHLTACAAGQGATWGRLPIWHRFGTCLDVSDFGCIYAYLACGVRPARQPRKWGNGHRSLFPLGVFASGRVRRAKQGVFRGAAAADRDREM